MRVDVRTARHHRTETLQKMCRRSVANARSQRQGASRKAMPLARVLVAVLACLPTACLFAQERDPLVGALATLAPTADDFKRNALLHGMAANAGEADLRRLLAALERQPSTPHRYDIARVLYIRFVDLDPANAADHALGRVAKPSWIDAVFRAWAHVDLEAAVKYGAALDAKAKQLVARAMLELELSAEQRALVVDLLDADLSAQRESAWAQRTSASDDMAAAWHRALQAPADMRRDRLREVAVAWAKEEPRKAMAMAAELAHLPRLRRAMESAIIGNWDENDPEGPIAWLEAQDQDNDLVSDALAHLARSDIDLALAKIDELPAAMREGALHGVLEVMSATAPQRAFEHFRSLDFSDQVNVLMTVAVSMPADANSLAWIETINPKLQRGALGALLFHTYGTNRDLALRLTDRIENPRLKAQWVREIAPREVGIDPHGAWRWANALPADLQEASGAVGAVFVNWHWLDRQAAVNSLLALRESPIRDQTLLFAIRHFSNNPAGYEPSLIGRFHTAISSADIKRQAAAILRDHYTAQDPNPVLAERYGRQAR